MACCFLHGTCRLLLCAQSPRLAQLLQAQAAAGNVSQMQQGSECKWTLKLADIYPDILALMLKVAVAVWLAKWVQHRLGSAPCMEHCSLPDADLLQLIYQFCQCAFSVVCSLQGSCAGLVTPTSCFVTLLCLQYMYCSLTSIPVESAALLFKAADR